jgi:hypothetical protein
MICEVEVDSVRISTFHFNMSNAKPVDISLVLQFLCKYYQQKKFLQLSYVACPEDKDNTLYFNMLSKQPKSNDSVNCDIRNKFDYIFQLN